MGGRGLLYGTGPVYNTAARSKDNFAFQVEAGDFSLFAPERFDFVLLGSVGVDISAAVVEKAVKHLKVGGHLILALTFSDPSSALPKINESMGKYGHWLVKDQFVNDRIVYAVFKKLRGRLGLEWNPTAKPPKACVSRLGAIGDMIIATPLLRCLKEDGYHVTVNSSIASAPVLTNNPNVDNVVPQIRNIVPNNELGQYWEYWAKRYDKYVNLSESIEGSLLKVEGRRDFYTTKQWRHACCNANYYDVCLAVGGYGHVTGRNGELFFTAKERAAAKRFLPKGTFNIMVSLVGTSHHKFNPLLGPVLANYLDEHPEVRILEVGDERASNVSFQHSRAIDLTGKTTLREVLAMVEQIDMVIGPETALTNAAGCFEVPKIVFLSHSTKENLTKYWRNCVALEPEGTPCYPCHQLHYSLDSCPLVEVKDEKGEVLTTGPVCSVGAVPAERIVSAIDRLREGYGIIKKHGTQMDTERIEKRRSPGVDGS